MFSRVFNLRYNLHCSKDCENRTFHLPKECMVRTHTVNLTPEHDCREMGTFLPKLPTDIEANHSHLNSCKIDGKNDAITAYSEAKKHVSVTRKCHNHRPQTNQWHREQEE